MRIDLVMNVQQVKNMLKDKNISIYVAVLNGEIKDNYMAIAFSEKEAKQQVIDAYYKENSSTLIFYNKMDTMYYLYQNNTMVLYCNKVQRVSFTLDDTMYDCEAPESWTASGLMNIIYTKFDTLLQSAPSPSDLNVNCRLSVSKVDMVDFLNQNTNTEWSYPEYNDGRKSNMYVISNEQSFRAGYNLGFENQKHKLLLIGGVHGNERLCQYNTN